MRACLGPFLCGGGALEGRRLVVVWKRGLPRHHPVRRFLQINQLTGSIPDSFSQLANLAALCALLACSPCLVVAHACVPGALLLSQLWQAVGWIR